MIGNQESGPKSSTEKTKNDERVEEVQTPIKAWSSTLHREKKEEGTKVANNYPPMVLYKIVQVQLSQNNVHEPEMQEWHFILVHFHKDAYKWYQQWLEREKSWYKR